MWLGGSYLTKFHYKWTLVSPLTTGQTRTKSKSNFCHWNNTNNYYGSLFTLYQFQTHCWRSGGFVAFYACLCYKVVSNIWPCSLKWFWGQNYLTASWSRLQNSGWQEDQVCVFCWLFLIKRKAKINTPYKSSLPKIYLNTLSFGSIFAIWPSFLCIYLYIYTYIYIKTSQVSSILLICLSSLPRGLRHVHKTHNIPLLVSS